MTTREEIETRLLRAVEVTPSEDGLRWLDQRVAQIATRPIAAARSGAARRRFSLRPLALVAAFVLLTGAVAAALGLLDRIIESSGAPGWRTAWDQAEQLDLSTTDAGVTITLERAYADVNQVLVGFTVAGLEAPLSGTEEPAAIQWVVELRDPAGRGSEQWAAAQKGMGMEQTGLSAVVQTWEGAVTPTAGTWVLTFTSVGYDGDGFVPGQCSVGATDPECVNPPPNAMVDGTWQFEFELPAPAGRVLPADASDTVGQATLHLTELRVTPTMIVARIGLSVGDSPVAAWWTPPFAIRHLDASYDVGSSMPIYVGDVYEGTGDSIFFTTAGSDEVSGTWEIEIRELWYTTDDGTNIQLDGPWTLRVDIP
jgi:hypothetical protein